MVIVVVSFPIHLCTNLTNFTNSTLTGFFVMNAGKAVN